MGTSKNSATDIEAAGPDAFLGRRWYAVHAQPNREFRAEQQLRNQGFEIFLPQRLKTVRHARRLTNLPAAFFPRYLFIQLDLLQHRWRSINGTFGVSSLVMRGDMPHPVPPGVVEAMIASVDDSGTLCLTERVTVAERVPLTFAP